MPGASTSRFRIRGLRLASAGSVGAAILATITVASALLPPAPSYARARVSSIAAAPGTPVDNVASGAGVQAPDAAVIAVQSNRVRTIVDSLPPGPPPALAFYRDAGYTATTRIAGTTRIHLQAIAPQCDHDPARPDTVFLTVASVLTGDVERFVAIETSSSSGRFRVSPAVALAAAQQANSGLAASAPGIVDTRPNDELIAVLEGCGADRTEARAFVEPHGQVYDARQDVAVAGARVTLIDVSGDGNGGDPGGPAWVFAEDGVTQAASAVTTGADGAFRFAWVPASTYRLAVATPSGYRFPSQVPLHELPAARLHDAAASYGGAFVVAIGGVPLRFDVPLDPVEPAALRVEITASRAWVEIGESFDYAVRVVNASNRTVTLARVAVALPPGFAYVRGTARIDSAVVADPAPAGARVELDLGTLGAGTGATVKLRVRVGAGAERGEAIATAEARAPEAVSNLASARVTVVDGVFADEASIVGTVFVDLDADRRRSEGDPGLPGVRLVLDDGTFAITDVEGRYSFYGITPRTHALRVDPATLPPGGRLAALDHRDHETPGLRSVDLQRGGLQRADFAVAADSATRAAPEERRRMIARSPGELSRTVRRALPAQEAPDSPGDPRARPTSAIWNDQGGRVPLVGPIEPDRSGRPRPGAARPHDATHPGDSLLRSFGAATLDPQPPALIAAGPGADDDPGAGLPQSQPFGFLDLADGDTLASDQLTVRVAGRAAFTLELRVNGETVPLARVGRRSVRADVGLQVWDYVGVRLRPGINLVELVERAADGVPGARGAITLVAPDRLGALELAVVSEVPADGASDAVLRIRALDARGVVASGRVIVTLEADRGTWRVDDVDPLLPGVQAVLENGAGEIRLGAPLEPGRAMVHATAGPARAEASLEFAPALRSMFAVGAAEWQLGWSYRRRGFATGRRNRSGFEQELTSLVVESGGRALLGGARASLFAKGRVWRNVLLTLGYDSDRPSDLRRFRDVQPDAFYPLYGDAAVRGYEAQSTGRLYARLDRRGASLLYGDFVTGAAGGPRSLASYSRSLTGVQHRLEAGRLRLDAFASRGEAPLQIEELAGRGVSGPYALARAPVVENSERVEILVRDRQQPGRLLSVTAKTRFLDYTLEPLEGTILFKQPVPGFDADLNPVSIRVTYESGDGGGGDAYWVAGLEGRVQVSPRVEVGASLVSDRDPGKPARLGSVFAGARIGVATLIEAELARTAAAGRADAGWRIEARRDDAASQGRVWATSTGADFANPHGAVSPGRTEAGVRWSSRWSDRTRVLSEGAFTADRAGGPVRGALLLGVDRRLARAARGEFGVRVSGERDGGGESEPASVAMRAKLTAQLPKRPGISGYAELEQDVIDPDRRLAALGGEYRFTAQARLYARHELSSSLVGPLALDTPRRLASVVGIDADVARSAHVFSEYRLADALSGREAEAALGLRNAWRLRDGYRISASFERVGALGGGSGPSTAATGAIESLEDPDVKMSARLEMRTSRASDGWLGTMAAAFRLDPAWSVIARSVASIATERARGTTLRERLQAGLAYRRPDREAFDALGRYELKLDRAPNDDGGRHRRLAHVVSFHTTGRMYEVIETSLAYAAKHVTEHADGLATRTGAHWVHARAARGFGGVWDAGVHASTLAGAGARRDGLGVEIGRQVGSGVWLSAGWNRFGYDDADLPEESYHRAGVYMRVRARFDETVVGRLTGGGTR